MYSIGSLYLYGGGGGAIFWPIVLIQTVRLPRDIKYMDWKRFRNLRVPENHPCCAYMDSELVSLLLTRTNMTWMLIPVDGFQGCSSKFSDLLYG